MSGAIEAGVAVSLADRIIAKLEGSGGLATMQLARLLGVSEEEVRRALMDLRREQKVMMRSGLWRTQVQRMLVAERGLLDNQRNRRWLALTKLMADEYGSDQEDAEVVMHEILCPNSRDNCEMGKLLKARSLEAE